MKKLLLILTAAILIISLTACGTGNKTSGTPSENASQAETQSASQAGTASQADPQLSGGWTLYTETVASSFSDDALKAFTKAVANVKDVTYTPVALLGSQVVAGTNYAFLVIEESDAGKAFKVLIIYSDLEGNAEITKVSDFNIEDYTTGEGHPQQQNLSGGWETDPSTSAQALPEDAQKAFDKATANFTGNALTPLALLGTQVVSGTNYAILCMGTTVTEEPVSCIQVVTIYEDTQGNAEISNIHTLDISAFN